MKVFTDFNAVNHGNRVRFEVMIDCIHYGIGRIGTGQVKMHDLAKRMYPGIGSARYIYAYEFADELFQRGFKNLLDRDHLVLELPPVIGTSIIFDGTFIALHRVLITKLQNKNEG